MNKYKSKPLEIEAIQYDNTQRFFEFLQEQMGKTNLMAIDVIHNCAEFTKIRITLRVENKNPFESEHYYQTNTELNWRDWIIKNSENELIVLPDKEFKKMFEPTAP